MALKANYYAEYHGKKVDYADFVKNVKDRWTADGKMMKDLVKLDIYYKPDESTVYYVTNESEKGSFEV
jgi:hypothetical protein